MQQLPFKTRFKAWWEGYETPNQSKAVSKRPDSRPRARKRCVFPPHIEIQHMLFGVGQAWPLPADPLSDLIDPVETPDNGHVLILGTETGAPAFALNRGAPQRLTLMEPDAVWCETGLALSRDKQEQERLHFGPVNLERMELLENSYDLFVSRLVLHHISDREHFYTKLERAMRRESNLVMVMFTVDDPESAEDAGLRMMSSLYPLPSYLQTSDDEQRLLTESGLLVELVEDITDPMLARLTECFATWRDLVDDIQSYDRQPELLDALLTQVEYWQACMKMLEDGTLQAVRIQAKKRGNELL